MVKTSKISLTTQILFALLTGLLVGIAINLIHGLEYQGLNHFLDNYIIGGIFSVFGKIFFNLIKMMVVPLVFVSLVCGIIGIGDLKKLGRVGGKTLFFYLMTTALAITIALLCSKLTSPGLGLSLENPTGGFTPKDAPGLGTVLINIIPTNIFNSLNSANMLQIIFFALLLGTAIASIGTKMLDVVKVFEELDKIMMKMVSIIMLVAPIGVFCLIAKVFAEQGMAAFLPLIKYMLTVVMALAMQALVVYSGALKILGRVSIRTFFKKFYSTMLVAFSTGSSNATIPATMKTVTEKLGVSKSIASFSVPFGATINMDGTAIMQGVAVVFISQVYGVDLSGTDYLMVILTATLASIGTAGVPGVGLITLAMVLVQVNLPTEGIALIIGVDRILDMLRTSVNITGDAIVSIIVSKSEGELDHAAYNDMDAGITQQEVSFEEIDQSMHSTQAMAQKIEQDINQ